MRTGRPGRRLLVAGLAAPLLWSATAAVPAHAPSPDRLAAAQAPARHDGVPSGTDDGKNPGAGRAPAMGSPGAPAVRGDDAWPAVTAGGVFAVSLGAAAYLLGWGRRRTA